MNRREIIRHNARLIRPQVRGKSKAERQQIYALIASGPIGLIAQAAASIVAARSRAAAESNEIEKRFNHFESEFYRGVRRSDHRFRL